MCYCGLLTIGYFSRTSAAALEKLLPPESRLPWSQRKDAELIVLLDWSTSQKSLQPGTNLYTLKNILVKVHRPI